MTPVWKKKISFIEVMKTILFAHYIKRIQRLRYERHLFAMNALLILSQKIHYENRLKNYRHILIIILHLPIVKQDDEPDLRLERVSRTYETTQRNRDDRYIGSVQLPTIGWVNHWKLEQMFISKDFFGKNSTKLFRFNLLWNSCKMMPFEDGLPNEIFQELDRYILWRCM